MVLEWTLVGLPTPGCRSDRSSLLQRQSTYLKGTWETQNNQAFYVSLVLATELHALLVKKLHVHDQSFSHI